MSDTDQAADVAGQPGVARIYGVVFSVGVVCALAIATVYEVTRPIIQRNRVALRERAILGVLPGSVSSKAFRLDESDATFREAASDTDSSELVFAGYDDGGNLVGVAIETQGMGYQDVIGLLYGYSFGDQAVIGIRVLESRETPGLGDRIEKDADFLRNFEKLDVQLDPAGNELAHPIVFVKPGTKTDAWQIDGITGATISSRAVAQMLGESTAQWMPRLHGQAEQFSIVDRGGT